MNRTYRLFVCRNYEQIEEYEEIIWQELGNVQEDAARLSKQFLKWGHE